jgi:hypothetical protein
VGNPTLMMKALEQYPEKYKAIKEKYFTEPVAEGSSEWFRRTMDILK